MKCFCHHQYFVDFYAYHLDKFRRFKEENRVYCPVWNYDELNNHYFNPKDENCYLNVNFLLTKKENKCYYILEAIKISGQSRTKEEETFLLKLKYHKKKIISKLTFLKNTTKNISILKIILNNSSIFWEYSRLFRFHKK